MPKNTTKAKATGKLNKALLAWCHEQHIVVHFRKRAVVVYPESYPELATPSDSFPNAVQAFKNKVRGEMRPKRGSRR